MDGKQQKTQFNLTSSRAGGGEASDGMRRGTEPDVVENETDSQVNEQLMEEILEKENLIQALKAVLRNKGAPGIDGMTVMQLPDYLRANWKETRAKLLKGICNAWYNASRSELIKARSSTEIACSASLIDLDGF